METLLEFKAIIFLLAATVVAVAIHKLLGKSNVALSGPFKGINVKVLGPLAGLVVVVFLLMYAEERNQEYRSREMERSFKQKEQEIRKRALSNWRIVAQIILLDRDGNEITGPTRENSLENLRTMLAPALPAVQQNYDRRRIVYFLPDDVVADPQSALQFTIQGDTLFREAYAAINCETAEYDSVKKIINLGKIPIMRR